MKRILITTLFLAIATSAYAEGWIMWRMIQKNDVSLIMWQMIQKNDVSLIGASRGKAVYTLEGSEHGFDSLDICKHHSEELGSGTRKTMEEMVSSVESSDTIIKVTKVTENTFNLTEKIDKGQLRLVTISFICYPSDFDPRTKGD